VVLLAGAALSLVWWLCVQAVNALETPHGDDSGVTLPRPASIRPFAASAATAGKEATWDAEDGAEDDSNRRASAMEVESFRCGPAVPVAWTGAYPSPHRRSHHITPCLALLSLFIRSWATIQAVQLITHEVTDAHFYRAGQGRAGQ